VNTSLETPLTENLYDFAPSAARALELDKRMRQRLSQSLQYIQAEAGGQLAVPQSEFASFVTRLERGSVSPLAFAFYSEIVLAIEDNEMEYASQLFQQILALRTPPPELVVRDLADPRTDFQAARYARAIDTDPGVPFQIFPPSPASSEKSRKAINAAFALMDQGDPELADEIRALLREVVLAAGSERPGEWTFDGASSFMLWGGILINANRDDGPLAMVQMLAHESSHNLLFGFSADESLIENSPEARYASPLRADPRPMDGIYHATFVTARMYRAVRTLLDSGVLNAEQRVQAEKELAENERLFRKGIATVVEHARCTPAGQKVIRSAIDYMAAHGVAV